MIVTLDAKRRLTVPEGLSPALPGDAFDARFDADANELVFRRIAGAGDWLAVLSECPVSMGDLQPRPEHAREPPTVLNGLLDTDVLCAPAKLCGDTDGSDAARRIESDAQERQHQRDRK